MTFRKDFRSDTAGGKEPGDTLPMLTDSYKFSHWNIYPKGTTRVYSYGEARKGGEYPETVFFGLQYILNKHFAGVVVNQADIERAAKFSAAHFGQDLFNREGWEYIVKEHGGKLPVSIKAVPEGTVVPESNVLFTVENTDPKCAWLTNLIETVLVQVWYPCTVATISREQKKVLKAGLEKSADTTDKLPFMLHDFGYRGSPAVETAALGGAAHLLNFMGSDTVAGMEMLMYYYGADMPAYSVPAAEHSTITAWGEDGEVDAYRHILKQYPTGLVSVVSDSWNIYDACAKLWGRELKSEIVDNPNRTLVVRPDSGDPNKVVPECLNILGAAFGYENNSKGYGLLPEYIRLIQGDGINRRSLPGLVDAIIDSGWSLDNVVFGSGGGLLQDCNRDTLRFAMKCSWTERNGKGYDVYKQPASDPMKNSKRGRLKLVSSFPQGYMTVSEDTPNNDVLREVFRNGEILQRTTLDEMRERAEVK